MDPKLLEILKRAKAVDKAAKKYDSSGSKKSTTVGLLDTMGGGDSLEEGFTPTMIKKDIGSENYQHAVKNSKLPPAIQRAMLENPIPQASSGIEIEESDVRELRGGRQQQSQVAPLYSEDDEVDFYEKPVRRAQVQQKRVIKEEVTPSKNVNINEAYLRKLIASELTKALPKIIENYFDSRLIKENVQFKAGNTVFSGNVMPMPKVRRRE